MVSLKSTWRQPSYDPSPLGLCDEELAHHKGFDRDQVLWSFVEVPCMARRPHLVDAGRNDEQVEAQVLAENFRKLLCGMPCPGKDLTVGIQGRRFELDLHHSGLIRG